MSSGFHWGDSTGIQVGLVSVSFSGLWNMLEIICEEFYWICSGSNKILWWVNESENWGLNSPCIS